MKKFFVAVLCSAALALPLLAESPFKFFSPEVSRHEGLGFGAFFYNQYAIGGWRDYAVADLGFGAVAEYTLPRFLPINMDFGASMHLDMGSTVPKKNSTLDSRSDIRLSFGGWVRIPFTAWGQKFAFQPEFAWGIDANNVRGRNGSKADGWFTDQIFVLAPALRWTPPGEKFEKLEVDFSPLWTFGPERQGNLVNELGFRLGIVWHTDLFSMGKGVRTKAEKERDALRAAQEAESKRKKEEENRLKAQEEERRKREEEARLREEEERRKAEEEARLKAEEEERRKAEEEARLKAEQEAAEEEAARQKAEEEAREAIEKAAMVQKQKEAYAQALEKPEFMLGVDPDSLKDFTPDGDGIHDTVAFNPSASYLSKPAESWTLKIIDPQGGEFRTWSGSGNPPAQIVWDGKSENGDLAFSQSAYKAVLEVVPSAADKEILGMDKVQASVEGSVEIDTGIVMKPEGEGQWRITMTTFRFDANAATFDKLDAAGKKDLDETLEKLVKKFNSVEGAHVTVEGYANNISGTREENEKDLLPLSQKRAEAIMELLAARGIARERLSAKGMGDANPIASREDRANWWKNRRIEFYIERKEANLESAAPEEKAAPVEEAAPQEAAKAEEANNENE